MKKYIILSFVVLSTAFYGCGSKAPESYAEESAPIAVKVSRVTTVANQPGVSVSGRIKAANQASLSTRVMGHVNSIKVKVGDRVRKGQLLLSINSQELLAKRAQVSASITEAKAALKSAEKDYQRFQNLFAKESATQKELDDMTTQFELAKARLEGAEQTKKEVEAQFAYTNLKAPFSGVVTQLRVEEGDLANPGMSLMELEAPEAFEVVARVPESEVSRIETDKAVRVHVKSLDARVPADLTEVSPSASGTGGQYLVKARLRKTEAPVLSGMFVTVEFSVKSAEKEIRVMIPQSALVEKGQLTGIYTVSQRNTAILRWLRLGRIQDGQVEVLSGLSAGESYIASAQSKLYNGAKISIQ